MQLIFDFAEWTISPRHGIVGRQYDNLSHSLVVEGELPSDYTWDMLVEAKGKYNIIPLSATATGATASLTADQLAFGDTYYAFQLRGTSGEIIHHTNAVQVYVPDTIVGPGTWPVLPTEFSKAEANIKELNVHPPVPGENGYWMLWDLDTHSYVQSQLVVPGLHIEIGETTTGEPGTPANVTNSGTNTAPVLNFTIPEGEKGDAATIQVGEVTASDPGSEPQVKNSGTENAAVFDFVLPRGQTGPTGQAATVEVESTITGEPGSQASVENVGTTGAAKLRFTIPRGNTGQNGVTPTLSAGNVETLEPNQQATASVTGEGPEYQINLGIPQGKTGETGAQGVQGEIGPRGYTFTPAVDDAGNLSWTNDGGLPNPEEVNIKGPIGATGPQGNPGATPSISVGSVTTLDPGQEATAEITGETPNLTLNLGIPEGQPGQDGVQLNDSAVNTTEAWSSKKIVDTLCPPFSVSDNPVVCHPVEEYPLSAVVTLEPKQAGSGDPSPENVRAISGYDEVSVNVRGKNLFDADSGFALNGDASIYGFAFDGEFFKEGVTYSFSAKNATEAVNIKVSYASYGEENLAATIPVGSSQQVAFHRNLNAGEPALYIFLQTGGTIYGDGVQVVSIEEAKALGLQIEASSTPTPYEPYQPGTTAQLSLPKTIYGGTVDAVTGAGDNTYIFKELAISDMDNTENYPGWKNVPWINEVKHKPAPDGDFVTLGIYGVTNIVNISQHDLIYSNGTQLYTTTGLWGGKTQSQIKEAYPDLVVQFCLQLVTPTPFQATGNQALPAVAGLNTVYTDGDSLAVSGRQDLLYTLKTMQAQTQNLNRFIAEGGTR